jgi:hypothetical protein
MSNVLLISYLVPPGAGVGSPRALNFARYLPQHGCRVFVLTARFGTTAYNDPDLLRSIPRETKVYRAFNPEIPYRFRDRVWKRVAPARMAPELGGNHLAVPQGSRWTRIPKELARRAIQRVACPDTQIGWAHFATRAAFRIVEKHGIDAVLLNTPPYSSMRIAVALKQRYPHLKLIADIRDDWVGYYLPYFDSAATEHKRQLAERLEGQLIRHSDYVSAVTPSQMRQIRERYADQSEEKFLCTPNGYDPKAFQDFQPRPHGRNALIVTYFGSVYGNPVYSPKLYLDAVDGLSGARIESRFIGRVGAEVAALFSGRNSAVRQMGFMPQVEGLRYLEETDVLLLIARDRTTLAGKLFDYLATGKPILALSPPDGEIARVLRETRTGQCVDPEDQSAIQRALLDAYHRIQSGTPCAEPDWEAIEAYAWPKLVASLARHTGIATTVGASR